MHRRTIIAVIAMGITGCAWFRRPVDAPAIDRRYPADFAVSFTVAGEPAPAQPVRQNCVFVLERDRTLYGAVGIRVDHSYRPGRLGRITPGQYDDIVQWVNDRSLMAEPTSPDAQGSQPPPVLYDVQLIGWGMINHYRTTPEESPPTVTLLAKLIVAAGGDIVLTEPTP